VISDAKTLGKVMHCKIVFVKVESSLIEISESVPWFRRCYAISVISVSNYVLLGSKGSVNQTHWRGTVVLESK